jgi:chromosome partitioning protein
MTKILSTINLKGGVGKTSITLALAEFLAAEHDKNVLVIDLDPQTNATVALMEEAAWLDKNEKGETLLQLFKDKLENTSKFDINKAIINKVSNLNGGIDNLSLLPSSLGLIDIQDNLAQIPAGQFYVTSPVDILKEAISGTISQYDFVLIDCPPNLGIITLNGIKISDYYIIPTIPDILSTYGIPQIITRIENFKKVSKSAIEPLGIIISMYRQTKLHSSIIGNLRHDAQKGDLPRVFNTMIPSRVKVAEAADFKASVNTLKQKYGYGEDYTTFQNLTNEVLGYVK